jgi:hypothetical protein
MKKKNKTKVKTVETTDTKKESSFDGYPLYPVGDDIYNKNKEEENLDPEDLSKQKPPNQNEEPVPENENNFNEDESGDDLDVPGAELDDQQEALGSEDEENNYYSLGGDTHNDLDEDRGY